MQALRPALLLFALLTAAVAVLQLLPRPGGTVAVVYPPGVAIDAALAGLLAAQPALLPFGFHQGRFGVIYAQASADTAPGRPPDAILVVAARLQPGCAPFEIPRTRT